jgi:hypothetical protein
LEPHRAHKRRVPVDHLIGDIEAGYLHIAQGNIPNGHASEATLREHKLRIHEVTAIELDFVPRGAFDNAEIFEMGSADAHVVNLRIGNGDSNALGGPN